MIFEFSQYLKKYLPCIIFYFGVVSIGVFLVFFHSLSYKLLQFAHALWMSKLRYGLQLCSIVRTDEAEMKSGNMKYLQIVQNKLMRLILNVPYKDRTSTSGLLSKTGLLSVNQLAASIKLCEVLKSENVENYPVKLEPNHPGQIMNERTMRPSTIRKWNQDAKSTAAKESFFTNAAKLWNLAPPAIKTAKSLSLAKKEVNKYFAYLSLL